MCSAETFGNRRQAGEGRQRRSVGGEVEAAGHHLESSGGVLHAFELPPGKTYDELHRILKARGFIIYAGQGVLSDRVFRLSAMGEISSTDLERLFDAFDAALK